uniref:Uncharacterized protein n=1 Tax=Photinus pyralis TaxID=7054 RepID=A0A1Y1NJ53_PHOPY
MTSYIPYNVYLSDNQKQKLKSCFQNKSSCSLRLKIQNPNQKINLTQRQINKIEKAKKEKKGCDIELSPPQLKQNGGFLPFLAALAPFIIPAAKAAALGAAGAAGAKIVQKIAGNGIKTPGKKYNGGGLKKKH